MFEISIIFYIPLSRRPIDTDVFKGSRQWNAKVDLHEKRKVLVNHYLTCDGNTVIFSRLLAKNNVVISIWCYWWSCLTLSVNLFWWFVLMEMGWVTFSVGRAWLCPALADAWWSPHPHPVPIGHPHVSDWGGGEVLSALLAFNWQLLHFYSTHTTTFAWGDCLYRCCQQPSQSRLLSLNSANRKRAPSRPVPWRYCQTSQKSITVKISSSLPSEGGVYSLLPVQSTT